MIRFFTTVCQMEILRVFFIIALFALGASGLCNMLCLLSKPHKWCELLLFSPIVWFILGIVCGAFYYPQTNMEWYLVIFGYPVLLVPVQAFSVYRFLSIYREQKQENEKFLYLSISQIILTIMHSFLWIAGIYVVLWSYSVWFFEMNHSLRSYDCVVCDEQRSTGFFSKKNENFN